MSTITRVKFINVLNEYAFTGEPNQVIDIMNELIDNNTYDKLLDLVFAAISSTQLYGFLSYLTDEEQGQFFECDYFRSNSYRGKKIKFYNRGQMSFLKELEIYKKIFFSAPTSFGKTSIIIEYILNHYSDLHNIVFIVPTNSLLEELFCKFLNYNSKLCMGYNVTTQPILKDGKNILFVTPERFMLIVEEMKLAKFDLIVMDESYKIVDSRNETVSDFVNNRAVRFRKVADLIGASNNKVVFLSPFTYTLTDSMKRFLDRYDIKKIDRRLEYVKREIICLNNSCDIKKYFHKNIIGYSSTSIKKSITLLNEIKNDKNIIYVANYSKAYELVDAIKFSCIKHPEDERYLSFLKHLRDNYALDGNETWKIIEALEKGVGIYISPIPRYIKREIINLYEKDIINTLIVTTAFTEGVNTSASNLIFTSLVNGPNINKLTDIDILNVSGRVGRFACSTVGRIYCISNDIYNRISDLQKFQDVRLENYNYKLQENRIDYEIDMVDDQYLSESDRQEKSDINDKIKALGLNLLDLRISLNVSNLWKISLYKYFASLQFEQLCEINFKIEAIYTNEERLRIDSLNYIFRSLKQAFDKYEIYGFPQENYEIHPFDNSGDFIWGRLYKVYASGSTKKIIANNLKYITTKFNGVVGNTIYNHKSEVEQIFEKQNIKWVLNYYKSDLKPNYNAFYSETFKFISNIIQYKIPFYLSFYVSIFKMYIEKNYINLPSDKGFDIKKLVNIFEDGDYDDEYAKLSDFGIPITLISKLSSNNVSLDDIRSLKYDFSYLDSYENMVIKDIATLL